LRPITLFPEKFLYGVFPGKSGFSPPQNLETPARPFSAALGRPKKFTISSADFIGAIADCATIPYCEILCLGSKSLLCGSNAGGRRNFGHEKTPEKPGLQFLS